VLLLIDATGSREFAYEDGGDLGIDSETLDGLLDPAVALSNMVLPEPESPPSAFAGGKSALPGVRCPGEYHRTKGFR